MWRGDGGWRVSESERERVCVCVCVCACAWERERNFGCLHTWTVVADKAEMVAVSSSIPIAVIWLIHGVLVYGTANTKSNDVK